MLHAGEPAPGFDLPDADMEVVSLDGFKNRSNVVLYFYPKDDMPGCSMEAIDFSDQQDEFSRFDTVVLGVSMDDCISHGSFRDKHGLAIRLLADVDGEVCGRYGVLHEKERDGRTKVCIQRSTFVIDKRGVLKHVLYGVNPRGHAGEVLGLLKGMTKCK
jgi:thioredoxin-dependent peroxiredoxin